jgi:hypothetical protein
VSPETKPQRKAPVLKPQRKPETLRWAQEIELEALNRNHFNAAEAAHCLEMLISHLGELREKLLRR